VLIIAIVWLPLRRTVTGRTIYAIGSAEGAAFMSGLPIVRAKLVAFTLAGLLAGIGGLFLAIETSSGNADLPQAGAYTLNSIAAVVIGGTSLAGGSGTIVGAALGVLIITTIDSGLVFYNVNLNYSEFVTGIVIIGAIALDRIAKRRRTQ
jgi:ribose transport system permease protein